MSIVLFPIPWRQRLQDQGAVVGVRQRVIAPRVLLFLWCPDPAPACVRIRHTVPTSAAAVPGEEPARRARTAAAVGRRLRAISFDEARRRPQLAVYDRGGAQAHRLLCVATDAVMV